MTIFDLFDYTIEKNASDLHLLVGYWPTVRINKELNLVKKFPELDETLIKDLIFSILSPDQKEKLFLNKEIDFGYEYKGYRFRTNVYFTRGKIAATFRLINKEIDSLEKLNLPSELKKFTTFNQGLILVTGPTGEGKSTTIASLVNLINLNYFKHIIIIEDPIEYIYPKGKSIVSQREIHQDTLSWRTSLRSALREDPDVVVVGEMRDYETIESVLTIAETGHLVFSTLHTGSTSEAINRIIDVFPSHQQQQVRTQLSSVLKILVAQRLIPRIDFSTRIPAVEILYNNMAVSSVIREGKTHLIDNILETSEQEGMIIFEKYLSKLYYQGLIDRQIALSYAIRPKLIEKFIK